MTELLDAVVIEPNGPARSSVIWLHGLGADGHDFAPVVAQLALPDAVGARFVLPHAPTRPVRLHHGMKMPSWYDIVEVDGRRWHDERDLRRAGEQVSAWIGHEHRRGVPWHRIAVAGFSQGGALALYTALRFKHRLAGVVALSTYLVAEQTLDRQATAENRDVPILQVHGSDDQVVPLARGEATFRALRSRGYDIEFHRYPIGHTVCPEGIGAVSAFLELVLT